jgi:hypothetical protein
MVEWTAQWGRYQFASGIPEETSSNVLVSETEPSLFLLSANEIEQGVPPDCVQCHWTQFQQVVDWARTYLCQPHPELGRAGPVCPFVATSLKQGLFWLTTYPGCRPTPAEIAVVAAKYREWFLELNPVFGKETEYKAILILFPDLPPDEASTIVDGVQAALKAEFIARGLMIGQFHGTCDYPALWNRQFHPLRSPVPLLAIRYMVPTDAPFLMKEPGALYAYLRRFGTDVPNRLEQAVREAATAVGLDYPIHTS